MSWLNNEDRAVLRGLADFLIPAAEGMPAASAVGVADAQMNLVENFRADLMPLVLRAIWASKNKTPRAALEALDQSDLEAANALKLMVSAAYYLSPVVRAELNYPGVQRHPFDLDDLPDGHLVELLRPVIARGPLWRRPPP
jgi:hypothetical protein